MKSHSFGCVCQPKFLAESLNFLVFEKYFYTASGIGILPAGLAADATPMNSFPIITSAKEMEEMEIEFSPRIKKWDRIVCIDCLVQIRIKTKRMCSSQLILCFC